MLNRQELLYALLDAARLHTEDLVLIRDDSPYVIKLNGQIYAVFLANVHAADRADQDESRIQCPGDMPLALKKCAKTKMKPVILGFDSTNKVFCAWDPKRFVGRSHKTTRFSIYCRVSAQRRARRVGYAAYNDQLGQRVVVVTSEFLGLYLENIDTFHSDNIDPKDLIRGYQAMSASGDSSGSFDVKRKKIEFTHTCYPRNPLFRAAVMAAYKARCAACEMQLEMIEAAHIIQHSHPASTDSVTNGLALCVLSPSGL